MNQYTKLQSEVNKWLWMKPHLESEEFDAVAMMMALESETDVAECLLELAESALEDARLAELVEARIKDLQGRKSRFEERCRKKRAVIGATMRNCGMKEQPIRGSNMTLSFKEGGTDVIVTDQAKLPKQYLRIIPEEEKVDMKALRAALESKIPVEGAVLSNGSEPSCIIRAK